MNPGKAHWIGGQWVEGSGELFDSRDPATGKTNWSGRAAADAEISAALDAARRAFPAWSGTSLTERMRHLHDLENQFRSTAKDLAESICRETGKPRWEALAEVESMAAKVDISIEAYAQHCREQSRPLAGAVGVTRFRPHGVLAVLGPFNMPGHLPNGHIIPALLAGNTVLFKPSEQTPLVGARVAEAIEAAGFPSGVVNVLQGGRQTGAIIAAHAGLDGILFTGSTAGGIALRRLLADQPGKILALEMGGNNPLIVHQVQDLNAAAFLTIQSAYVTAGQRCSCARRLIVCRDEQGEAFIQRLIACIANVRVGFWTDAPEPFVGTMISSQAADDLLAAQDRFIAGGALPLVKMQRSERSAALLSPGLIDVTAVQRRPDVELFGPLLQVIRVDDFAAAMREANQTAYGLSAGLVSDNEENYKFFLSTIRAGVLSWNRPLTGASSQLPFGGIGQSGNHRPGGYWAADYAAYPVAAMESPKAQMPGQLPPGLTIS